MMQLGPRPMAGSGKGDLPVLCQDTAADPLSDVLRMVKLTSAVFHLVDASFPWGVEVPGAKDYSSIILPRAQHVISYHIILKGSGWVEIPGVASTSFEAGDILVLAHGDPYSLLSTPGQTPEYDREATIAFFREWMGGKLPFVTREGGGGSGGAEYMCGFLGCDMRPLQPNTLSASAAVARQVVETGPARPAGPPDRSDANRCTTAANGWRIHPLAVERTDLRRSDPAMPRIAARAWDRLAVRPARPGDRQGLNAASRTSRTSLDSQHAGRRGGHVAFRHGGALYPFDRPLSHAIFDALANADCRATSGRQSDEGGRRGTGDRLRVRSGLQPSVQEGCGYVSCRMAQESHRFRRLIAGTASCFSKAWRQAGCVFHLLREIALFQPSAPLEAPRTNCHFGLGPAQSSRWLRPTNAAARPVRADFRCERKT